MTFKTEIVGNMKQNYWTMNKGQGQMNEDGCFVDTILPSINSFVSKISAKVKLLP